ncbi:MAG: DUF6442 family protein [Roseburia sp.]|nr:DUF6442 family protein [Roseburia sp.]
MEENENKPEEYVAATAAGGAPEANTAGTEEEKQTLSREEILAISRKENKNGDERDACITQRAMQFAFAAGLLVVGIVQIVLAALDRQVSLELYMVYTAMVTTQGLYCAIKMTKHKGLFIACGVMGGLTFVSFTVMWILQLCGVAL